MPFPPSQIRIPCLHVDIPKNPNGRYRQLRLSEKSENQNSNSVLRITESVWGIWRY